MEWVSDLDYGDKLIDTIWSTTINHWLTTSAVKLYRAILGPFKDDLSYLLHISLYLKKKTHNYYQIPFVQL